MRSDAYTITFTMIVAIILGLGLSTTADNLRERQNLNVELDIKKNLWFFDCHFKTDPVMPGCLGLDAMWQLVGFFLGWVGNPGKGRALGVGEVKFTGEVLSTNKLAKYIIEIKRIMKKGETSVGLADGMLLIDNKKIYSTKNLKVGLFRN